MSISALKQLVTLSGNNFSYQTVEEGITYGTCGERTKRPHLSISVDKGVQRYYPETPKESYIAPWEAMAEWEQASAIAVYEQVEQFVEITNRQTAQLSREQKRAFCRAMLDWADLCPSSEP